MAKSNAVWGIDIGHCALKALCCSLDDDGKTLVAEAFDYVEYPKLLTQPDANPEQLVKDALQQFLSNHNLRGAQVGISVSGQSGLARFIKLPPVDAKKVPDIVKYEAKQQIPFPLEDVIWDYERLGGGVQDDGIAMETEVGLFAMKRDQVFKALRPYRDASIELNLVQLTPIAIYNAVTYGVLKELPAQNEFDPDNPPDSVVVISMGTETTDLVITNGFKIWQRSIPIGGSHFTKQLMKEMKLTFAKAEHLKRNAREAADPKAVFQAMRPIFNDMVQELQRSIGFFRSIDREANITKGVVLGNTVRLPGLQPYLEKNLELPMVKVAKYENLSGSSVISTPKFKDNILSFAVTYGLCIQNLKKSRLSTNLIPRELITARLVRQKKPWAVAAAAILMLGMFLNYVFHWSIWNESHKRHYEGYNSELNRVASTSNEYKSRDVELFDTFKALKVHGDNVVGGADNRFLVLELMKVLDQVLPFDAAQDPNKISGNKYPDRPELHIEYIESQYFPEGLSDYVSEAVTGRYEQFHIFLRENQKFQQGLNKAAQPVADADDESTDDDVDADVDDEPADDSAPAIEIDTSFTSKPGWVIQIGGYHFFTKIDERQHLYNTILNALDSGTVMLPPAPGEAPVEFTMKEMGIHLPILATDGESVTVHVPDPNYVPPAGQQRNLGAERGTQIGTQLQPGYKSVPAFEFVIQFCWIETRASQRMENRKLKASESSADDEG